MMENSLISGVYPVVTIKEKNRIRRFVCNSVMVSQREGCTILTFFRPSEEAVQYWGNRAHGGEQLTLDYFLNNESLKLSKKHNLDLGVVEEFQRVIKFLETPVYTYKVVKV